MPVAMQDDDAVVLRARRRARYGWTPMRCSTRCRSGRCLHRRAVRWRGCRFATALNFPSSPCARPACRSGGCRCSCGRTSRPRCWSSSPRPSSSPRRSSSCSSTTRWWPTSSCLERGGDPLMYQHVFSGRGTPTWWSASRMLPGFGIVENWSRRASWSSATWMMAFSLLAIAVGLHRAGAPWRSSPCRADPRPDDDHHRDHRRADRHQDLLVAGDAVASCTDTPMLWAMGFIVMFTLGGISADARHGAARHPRRTPTSTAALITTCSSAPAHDQARASTTGSRR